MDWEALNRRLIDLEIDATCRGDLGRMLRLCSLRMRVLARILGKHIDKLEANDR